MSSEMVNRECNDMSFFGDAMSWMMLVADKWQIIINTPTTKFVDDGISIACTW